MSVDNTNVTNPHDFQVIDPRDGKFQARIWHSDKGEWTVDFANGASRTYRSVNEARDAVRRKDWPADVKTWNYMTETEDREQYGPVENLG